MENQMNYQSTLDRSLQTVKQRADQFMQYAILAYFALGLLLSIPNGEWEIAFANGVPALLLYFIAKLALPKSKLYQYLGSISLALFMAQFIYQMHGMFEMHFFAFVSALILMAYQNWRLQIPNLLVVVVHHSVFAYLQYLGFQEIYFTQLAYMDLGTFIVHALLAAVIVGLAAYWSFQQERSTKKRAENEFKLALQVGNLNKNIAFANEISNGNLDAEYNINEDDVMGASLLSMRDGLKEAKEREDTEKYINVGLSTIGDILRQHMENVGKLSEAVLSPLIKYLGANQGAIFLLSNVSGEKELELTAAYAYNRKKYLNKNILVGEGIVGAAFLEKEPIFMTDIPEDYLQITSGLGNANPRNLFVVPLINNEQVVGVLEVASFNNITSAQRKFLLKVCESIASTIVTTRTTEQTALLLEESQRSSEALRAQEEEMRQNMEELQATQEEMRRQNFINERYTQAVDNSTIIIDFDSQGNVIHVNQKFEEVTGYAYREIVGQKHTFYVPQSSIKSGAFEQLWKDLSTGQSFVRDVQRVKKNGQLFWLRANYMPMRDQQGQLEKISCICFDITDSKEQELAIKQNQEQLDSIIKNTPGFIYRCLNDSDWTMLFASTRALEITGYEHTDFTSRKITLGDLIVAEDQKMVADEVEKGINENKAFDVKYRIKHKDGDVRWVWDSGSLSSVNHHNGQQVIEGIIVDITTQKKLELESQRQMEEINAVESELRNNIEELQAAQEEAYRVKKIAEQKEENLKAILNNTSDTIFAIDKKYRITLANQVLMEKYLAQGINLSIGKNVQEVIPESLWQLWKDRYDRALSGVHFSFVEERTDAGGNTIKMEVQCSPIFDDKKQVKGCTIVSRDITRYKAML